MKQIKSFLSMLVALMIMNVASAAITWDGSETEWTQGTGTESDPYLIETPQHLSYLGSLVNAGVSMYNSAYYKQTADFDMNSIQWMPIGTSANKFKGHYDGNNKYISNLQLLAVDNLLGLFGCAKNAEFKGIIIKGDITTPHATDATGSDKTYYSPLLADGESIIFINCINETSINKNFRCSGGIAARLSGSTLTNCTNKGNVVAITVAGGLIGIGDQCNITRCSNSGKVSASSTHATYSGNGTSAGGIAGAFSGCISESYNIGKVSASYSGYNSHVYASGITPGSTNIQIKNCYVRASISAGGWQDSDIEAAGISSGSNITNSYFVGTVSGNPKYSVGGTNSYYDSDVYGSTGSNGKTTAQMKSASMPVILNGNTDSCWMSDVDNINDGYPILKFQKTTATISVNAINGHVQGGGTYSVGSSVTLTAIPNEGFVFSHWSDGNTDNPRTVTATENAHYTAFFISNNIEDKLIFVSHQDGSSIGLASLASHQTIEYSTDGTTWNNMTTATTVTLNSGDMLYMRGVLSDDNTSSDYTQFSMSGSIAASGNINYLWNYQNINEPLKVYCGLSMFKDCSALVKAPELPSTSLAEHCYQFMFQNCTSLLSAPELPATTLANSCYLSMFQECTSLTSAPELPALTLANHCYWRMFRGCTSLATAPELPATILTMYCYNQMFMQTAITRAPELRAPVLADNCYYGMFYQCSQLNYIQCFATDVSASGCTEKWVQGVATSGTFVKNSTMNKWVIGNNGIPTGWMTEDYVVLNEYEVTFVDWDGTILKTEHVLEGTSATAPENPSREWHTFTGWDKDFSIITTNLIVTAQYKEGQTLDYTLLFTNGNDNSEIATRFIALELPAPPTIAGFLFQKWVIVGGDLDGVIEIQAIYSYQGAATSAPAEVVINSANPTRKLIRNGNVYILMGDKTYTVTGQEIK